MATTYLERLDEARVLEASGKGLSAIALPDRDIVLVRDPLYVPPGDELLPEDQRHALQTWREFEGGSAATAYGL